MERYAFCAKGLGNVYDLTVFPGVLLVSPDKRILKCEKIEEAITLIDKSDR